ncbi:MAG: hypothetical protein ABIO76_09250 [Ginsengibacter sp.]
MNKAFLLITVFLTGILYSCHKKISPAKTPVENIDTNNSRITDRGDSAVLKKPEIKRKPKVPVAKVITVDDNAAHQSVDGRLYYDVLGRRYWKNYKDGKYYLFNKSMYTDPAFKKPG